MPKQLQQPEKLEYIAISRITKWVLSQINKMNQINPYKYHSNDGMTEDFTTKQIEAIRDYFKYLPGIIINNVFEKLKKELLWFEPDYESDSYYERSSHIAHVTSRMIEVLFTKNLSFISLADVEIEYFRNSLNSKIHLLEGLIKLELNLDLDVDFHDNVSLNIAKLQFLNKLLNLKHLILTYSNDNLLNHIINNCKSVEILDLYNFYYKTTINAIDKFNLLPNLKIVSLYESIYCDPFEDHNNEYKQLILKYIALQKLFDIKSYINYTNTRLEDLQYVIEKYPNIQSLKFINTETPYLLNSCCIEALNRLQNLKELEIIQLEITTDLVKRMFEVIGKNVEVLKLQNVTKIDLKTIKYIGLLCPNLQKLTISNVTWFNYDMVEFDTEIPVFKNLCDCVLHFSYIESFRSKITPSESTYNQFVSSCLLASCPNIETIQLYNMGFKKDFFLEVLDTNSFKCLKKLKLYVPLDKLVIDCFIEKGVTAAIESDEEH